MLTVAIPGEAWEIDFIKGMTMKIERFRSNG
jgi:hypothetical protein